MILLKAAILFVLANPAEFYPLNPVNVLEEYCGQCSKYLFVVENGQKIPLVPEYPIHINLQSNKNFMCGPVKRQSSGMKTNNVTMAKNTKIVGGTQAFENQFPWQVGIAGGFGSEIHCGGSIISSKEILTAAHCVQSHPYNAAFYPGHGFVAQEEFPIKGCIYAVVGEHNTEMPRHGEEWIRICDVKKHPLFVGEVNLQLGSNSNDRIKMNFYNNDFAVLTMCWDLLFGEKVSPVCLPPPQVPNNAYEGFQEVEATGWGFTSTNGPTSHVLKKVKLFTMSNHDCYHNTAISFRPPIDDDLSKICAFDYVNRVGTCRGDSGGPLVIKDTSSNNVQYYTLIGVASHSHKECAEILYPDVFARVTAVMTWLNGNDPITNNPIIKGERGQHPALPQGSGPAVCTNRKSIELMKDSKNSRSLKNTGGVTYYHFEKDKKLSRMNAEKTCISKYGGQLTSINTQDEYEWIKEQVKDLKMFGQIAIGGQWKDKSSRKFEWTDESEMDMSVLNANWFRTRNYQFPSYKNKKRINLELWYSRRALGFANALDHKASTMYICKVADSCSA